MSKIKWKGSEKRIPDLGVTVKRGDIIEVPAGVTVGGKGVDWDPVKSDPKPKTPKPTPKPSEE